MAREKLSLLNVIYDVRTAYFAARAAQDLAAVARDTLANQEKHLQQAQGFVQAGARPEIDLAQARADVANAQVQRLNFENTYATARAQLVRAMGQARPADFRVAEDSLPAVEGEDGELESLMAEASAARPDLAALNATCRAQELRASALRGGYGPSLGVA